MANRSMRDNMQAPMRAQPIQAAPLARPAPPQIRPQPVLRGAPIAPAQPIPNGPITDVNGNRIGARPVVGPGSPAQVHSALQANDAAVARAPRPVQAPVVQAGPAAQENPTRNLGAINAAQTIQNQKYATEKAIDEQSR